VGLRVWGDELGAADVGARLSRAVDEGLRDVDPEAFAADGGATIDRDRLRAKADELDARIRRLRSMRDGLRHAAECTAANHAECPTFRRMLRLAGAGRLAKVSPPPSSVSG
jgi:hypothetical protein